MDTNMLIGCAALAFGLFTLVMRFVAPNSGVFGKLQAMKDQWGDGPGTALHWFAYTLLPLGFGAALLIS